MRCHYEGALSLSAKIHREDYQRSWLQLILRDDSQGRSALGLQQQWDQPTTHSLRQHLQELGAYLCCSTDGTIAVSIPCRHARHKPKSYLHHACTLPDLSIGILSDQLGTAAIRSSLAACYQHQTANNASADQRLNIHALNERRLGEREAHGECHDVLIIDTQRLWNPAACHDINTYVHSHSTPWQLIVVIGNHEQRAQFPLADWQAHHPVKLLNTPCNYAELPLLLTQVLASQQRLQPKLSKNRNQTRSKNRNQTLSKAAITVSLSPLARSLRSGKNAVIFSSLNQRLINNANTASCSSTSDIKSPVPPVRTTWPRYQRRCPISS